VAERWVINASPVILLAKAGLMDLLPRLCAELVVPKGVVREVTTGARSDAGRAWLAGPGRRFVMEPLPIPPELHGGNLGRGEAEVLAWARDHPGFTAVLDDRQGRRWAERLGVSLIGSLGAIIALKNAGLIPQARPAIECIEAAGGYPSKAAVRAALLAAGDIASA
jgi:hypothetical protein